MKTKLTYLTLISAILIALDQVTKIYVQTHFLLGETVDVIRGYFNITYIQNPGAAFGFLANTPPLFRDNFFLIIPPLAMILILYFLKPIKKDDYLQIFALSSVFGGALGNYIDRLRVGYVIDFLDFHIQHSYSWPAFNIADSAIVCGILILLYLSFKETRQQAS